MTDNSFHEVLFPEDISYASSGGPQFNTTIISLTSGFEQRNINWQDAKCQFEATQGVKTIEQMEILQEFFYARMGQAFGFRYKDWADFKIEDGEVCVATTANLAANALQFYKVYEPVSGYRYDRIIQKFVPGSLDGNLWYTPPDATDPTTHVVTHGVKTPLTTGDLDYNSGLFHFHILETIPVGSVITVDYIEFHVPVRFNTDSMKITQDDFGIMSWPSIELVEVKLKL